VALGDKFYCIRLIAFDGVEEHIRPGDSFVDDTTCRTTNDDPDIEPTGVKVQQLTESEEKLVTRMQNIVQFFLDILQVTGGDLAPEKCAWYLICHDGKMEKQDYSNRMNTTKASHFCHALLAQPPVSRGKHQRQDTKLWDFT
jgi:hypothetical protein